MNKDDEAFQKLMYTDEYHAFFLKYTEDMLKSEPFEVFYKDAKYPDLIRGYLHSLIEIFLRWHSDPQPQMSLEKLADRTAELVTKGLNG